MALPDYTTQDAATYKANIDESIGTTAKSTTDLDTRLDRGFYICDNAAANYPSGVTGTGFLTVKTENSARVCQEIQIIKADAAENKIYIRSTTDSGSTWSGWQILGTGLNTKVLDIGDWDMTTSTGTHIATVAHGIDYTKIRSMSCIIRDDTDAYYYDFGSIDTTETTQHIMRALTTNIELVRGAGGVFDTSFYDDDTSFNRGWVTIQYTD